MDEAFRERIANRIAQLIQERDTYVTAANQQVALFNGGIQALQELLASEVIPTDNPQENEKNHEMETNHTSDNPSLCL